MKKAEIKIHNNSNLYPGKLADVINENLKKIILSYKNIPDILRKSISYSLKNGGKRLRPVLTLATVDSLKKNYEIAIPLACAIEFIHTYSLIHDDLPSIDNDDYRRGKLTCHRFFGEDIAILTGDALFAEAFNIILKWQRADPHTKIKLLEEISLASGAEGMVAGQIIDVFYTGKKITKKTLQAMHYKKTGKLIEASVRCGAILAKASPEDFEKLSSYAANIGLAFQITDDILDIESNSKIAGKTMGKDANQKKNTFPSIYGIEKSRMIAFDRIQKAINIVETMDIKREHLINIARFILNREK